MAEGIAVPAAAPLHADLAAEQAPAFGSGAALQCQLAPVLLQPPVHTYVKQFSGQTNCHMHLLLSICEPPRTSGCLAEH